MSELIIKNYLLDGSRRVESTHTPPILDEQSLELYKRIAHLRLRPGNSASFPHSFLYPFHLNMDKMFFNMHEITSKVVQIRVTFLTGQRLISLSLPGLTRQRCSRKLFNGGTTLMNCPPESNVLKTHLLYLSAGSTLIRH